jgi:hypothetical protein
MNLRSPVVVLFVVALALVLIAGAVAMLVPALLKLGLLVASIIPLLFTLAGLFDCIRSGKASNTILLWIVIIILAPLLGPLLWFAWGRKHT